MLLLREDRLAELELRLLPLALARSLRPLLLLLRLLRPLDALPRLLLREGDDPDFEEEEELRDGMACSFVDGYNGRRRLLVDAVTCNLGRSAAPPVGTDSSCA